MANRVLLFLTIFLPSLVSAKYNKCPPVIFNFGDSNSDTGGFVAGNGTAIPLPNGRVFFEKATGRSNDGRVILDFLCEHINSNYLSAYLEALGSDFTNGANFAVAGAATGVVFNPFTLTIQVGQFRHFRNRSLDLLAQGYKNVMDEKVFRNAVYTIDIGQNDISGAFNAKLTSEQVIEKVPTYLAKIEDAIRTLYGTGARKFWVHNTAPFGCFPGKLAIFPHESEDLDSCGCLDFLNDASRAFNDGLDTLTSQLRLELNGSTIIYNDIYKIKYNIVCNYTKYGFEHPFLSCCGTGGPPYNFDPSRRCGVPGVEACPLDEGAQYISWDGAHYSEAANTIVASKLLSTDYSTPRFKFENLFRCKLNTKEDVYC